MADYSELLTVDGEQVAVVNDGLRFTTKSQLKKQMRVDDTDEDDLIILYGRAAEDAVIDSTNRTFLELCEIGRIEQNLPEGTENIFPTRLIQATLMLASHFYRNRELVSSISQNIVPHAYDVLIKPYRKLC